MLRLILLFLFAHFMHLSNAQTFNTRMRDNAPYLFYESLISIGDSIYCTGNYGENYNPFPGRISFYSVQGNGNLLTKYRMATGGNLYYIPYQHSTFLTSDTSSIIIGGTGEGSPGLVSFFLKLDKNFDEVHLELYDDTLNNISYFVSGTETKSKSLYISNFYQQKNQTSFVNTSLYHLNLNGEVIWVKKYNDFVNGKSLVPNLIESYKYGLLLMGCSQDVGSINGNIRPKLIFIDTAGVVQRTKYLDYKIKGISGIVIDTTDYSMVYCSRIWDSLDLNNTPYYSPYISKIDSNGNKLWAKEMGLAVGGATQAYSTFNQIKRMQDGKYLTVGNTAMYETDTSGFLAGYLVKFETRMIVLKYYGRESIEVSKKTALKIIYMIL